MLLAGVAFAAPSSFFKSEKQRVPGEPPAAPCAELMVEPELVIRRSAAEAEYRVFDFVITVSVANPCPEPLEVRFGSYLSYRTSFPAVVPSGGQPAACVGQQWSFSGTVPPLQRTPFTLRADRCVVPAASLESPRVAVETGTVITDRGERPVAALSRSAD